MTTHSLKFIENRVKDVISDQFGVAVERVDMADNLERAPYNADSLDMVEMALTIEDDFGIEVPDDDMRKFTTGKTIVEYVHGARGIS
jgi:acyl carrier protein